MIERGTYRARAIPTGVKFGRASTGTEQIAVPFAITDDRSEGGTVMWLGNFANEQAIEITVKGLRAAGWTGDSLTDLSGLGDVECEIVIIHEPDRETGEPRVKVKWVNEIGGGFKFKTEMGAAEVTDLANRVRGAAMAMKQGQGAKPAAQSRKQAPAKEWDGTGKAPPGGTDEIPF